MTNFVEYQIMVVEDNLDTRELIQEILEREGYSVHAYPDGKDALEAIAGGDQPKVILLDWRMPITGGKEFLAEVKTLPVAVTAQIYLFSAEGDQGIFDSVGCAGVVQKPVNVPKLLALLEEIFLTQDLAHVLPSEGHAFSSK